MERKHHSSTLHVHLHVHLLIYESDFTRGKYISVQKLKDLCVQYLCVNILVRQHWGFRRWNALILLCV